MKYKYTLKTNQHDFIEYLIHSLLLEIYKNTDLSYLKEDLHPGFTYHKTIKDKYGKEYNATVEILEINENNFKTKLALPSTTHIIDYSFDKNLLIYTEEMISNSKLLKLNHKIMSHVFSYKLKKQIKKKLTYIEKYIEGKQI